jgi:DNA-binding Lrp family transcriptional regulator
VSKLPKLDAIDLEVVLAMGQNPRETVLALAARLGLARNTVQARLGRLEERGLLARGSSRALLTAAGYPVRAYITIETAQGRLRDVVAALAAVPEVLEAFAVMGEGDLMCQVAARDTDHLYDVVEQLLHVPGIQRTRSALAMRELLPFRVEPLLGRGSPAD